MAVPSIKGAVLRGPVELVKAELESGVISESAALARLGRDGMALISTDLRDANWYSVDHYEQICLLLQDQLGRFNPKYTQRRGAESAERLLKLGVYQQVKFLRRINDSETLEVAYQNLKLTATLWGSFFNFGQWTTRIDQEAMKIFLEVTGGGPMPEVAWEAIEGFIQRLATEVESNRVSLTRDHLRTGQVRFTFVLRKQSEGE